MFGLLTLFLQLPILAVLALPTTDVSVAKITEYGLNGSGCPPGSASISLADGGSSLVASFSKFSPQVSDSEFRQNCQATIEVAVPPGKKFTVKGVQYEGFVQVTSNVAVRHESLYYFQGEIAQKTSSAVLSGPLTGHKDLSNEFTDGAIWSSCGAGSAIVNINIAVLLSASKGYGYTTVDNAKIGPFQLVDC